MIVALLVLSLAGVAAALLIPGYSDLLLLAGPIGLAAILILLRGRRAPAQEGPHVIIDGQEGPHVIIDGSNVLHWQDNTPSLEIVKQVIESVKAQGLTPGVIFDANAGYKIGNRYRDEGAFARLLGLPEDRVLVVPKGTPADAYILAAARDLQARVVTNDRYRDWAETYPEVAEPGFLIRGGVRDGAVWVGRT